MPVDATYIRRVIRAYHASPDRMGHFPLPTFEVTVAAEILKDHVTPGPGSHAVEVAQLRDRTAQRFVFGNSGVPGALQVNVEAAQKELRRWFGPGASYLQIRTGFDFYEPEHRDTHDLMTGLRGDFNGETNLIRLQDVTDALGRFRTLVVDHLADAPVYSEMHPGQKRHWGKALRAGESLFESRELAPPPSQLLIDRSVLLKSALRPVPQGPNEQAAVTNLFAAAAALVLRLVEDGDRANIRLALTGLKDELLRLRIRGELVTMGNQLDALLRRRPGEDIPNPPGQIVGFPAFQGRVDAVFRALTQSRYCAEPRVFAAIAQDKAGNGRLDGQICFWTVGQDNTPNPNEYQVIGPVSDSGNAALSGSYMWACSSCKARSRTMLSRIPRVVSTGPRYHEV